MLTLFPVRFAKLELHVKLIVPDMHCNKDASACCEARPMPYSPRNSLVQKARTTGLYALFAATLLAVVTFSHFRIFRPASPLDNNEQRVKVETGWDWAKV